MLPYIMAAGGPGAGGILADTSHGLNMFGHDGDEGGGNLLTLMSATFGNVLQPTANAFSASQQMPHDSVTGLFGCDASRRSSLAGPSGSGSVAAITAPSIVASVMGRSGRKQKAVQRAAMQ